MKKSQLEENMLATIKLARLPEPTREYRFHETRKWRFDFAWPEVRIAIEVEGGAFGMKNKEGKMIQGGHNRGAHMTKDCEKYNTAQLMGWKVYRFTAVSIRNGDALEVCEELNKQRLYS